MNSKNIRLEFCNLLQYQGKQPWFIVHRQYKCNGFPLYILSKRKNIILILVIRTSAYSNFLCSICNRYIFSLNNSVRLRYLKQNLRQSLLLNDIILNIICHTASIPFYCPFYKDNCSSMSFSDKQLSTAQRILPYMYTHCKCLSL